MNSRRLMCSPESEDCTLPHRDRKYRVVHRSKFGSLCLSWVIQRRGQRISSAVHSKAVVTGTEVARTLRADIVAKVFLHW
jgi:hypothetical protein